MDFEGVRESVKWMRIASLVTCQKGSGGECGTDVYTATSIDFDHFDAGEHRGDPSTFNSHILKAFNQHYLRSATKHTTQQETT